MENGILYQSAILSLAILSILAHKSSPSAVGGILSVARLPARNPRRLIQLSVASGPPRYNSDDPRHHPPPPSVRQPIFMLKLSSVLSYCAVSIPTSNNKRLLKLRSHGAPLLRYASPSSRRIAVDFREISLNRFLRWDKFQLAISSRGTSH